MPPKNSTSAANAAGSADGAAPAKKVAKKKAADNEFGNSNIVNGNSNATEAGVPEPSAICTVCCDDVKYYAVGPCNHRGMCHICSLRMRALSDSNDCVLCRHDCDEVIFTKDASTPFSAIPTEGKPFDKKLKIHFASTEVYREVQRLFQFTCQICKENFKNMRALKDHLKKEHEMFLCELCFSHTKLFLGEQKLYTRKDLAKHRMFGDAGKSAFKGHPICEFCKLHFYGDDELYVHLRDKHFRCDICLRQDPRSQHIYYADYAQLKDHFEEMHIMCEDEECQEKKFVVFATLIDYKVHVAEEHSKGMHKAERKQIRKLDLNFSYGDRADADG